MSAGTFAPSAFRNDRPVLETNDLTVTYGRFIAADRVDLAVRAGEIYGLLGPNGAGKTSVIRALTTIVPIASGSATICGHPLTEPMAVRANIGVLPESNGYPGAQTGHAYLTFFGRLFGMTANEASARAGQVLDEVGLGDNRGQLSTYSRGMRQRLGLARALINRPALLFLDEPTLGLDPAGQANILAYLTSAAEKDGMAVILCSHLLDEIDRVCDRVGIMHRGRIVEQGSVEEVIERAGVAVSGTIQVSPDSLERTTAALRASPQIASLDVDAQRPGAIDIELTANDEARTEVLRCVLDAGADIRAFDLRRARLSTAFLAITQAVNADGQTTEEPS